MAKNNKRFTATSISGKNKPTREHNISGKNKPTSGYNITDYRIKKPAWQIAIIDNDSRWGLQNLINKEKCDNIFTHLKDRETMTWEEIEKQSGGRNKGTNNHYIKRTDLCKEAIQRLEALEIDDTNRLFSLRAQGKIRIWGVRQANVLKILWFDPKHEVCPSPKKHS
ncbi:MAG: hypothetical protein K0U39_06140 [Alphaproteobacteria bacterium]|nr:hypothetical protein [Alphaproteobacteria bacterium]